MNTQLVKAAETIKKHAPEILTATSVATGIAASVFTVTGTIKAVRLVDATKEELGIDKLPPKVLLKTVWKCYIPAVALGATSIGCGIASTTTSVKRTVAMTAIAETERVALDEFRAKAREVLSEKDYKKVEDKIVEDKMNNNPPTDGNVYVTGNGDSLVYDKAHDRWFKSNYNALELAKIAIYRTITANGYISENECYYEFGAKGVASGDYRGYNTSMFGTRPDFIDIRPYFGPNHEPCFVLLFNTEPIERYDVRW